MCAANALVGCPEGSFPAAWLHAGRPVLTVGDGIEKHPAGVLRLPKLGGGTPEAPCRLPRGASGPSRVANGIPGIGPEVRTWHRGPSPVPEDAVGCCFAVGMAIVPIARSGATCEVVSLGDMMSHEALNLQRTHAG